MLLSDFDYYLPEELIAQKPLEKRDLSKMMILNRRTGEVIHSRFQELINFLNKGDVLVLNDSKVIPARVWGRKMGREIEFLFLKGFENETWEVLCRPAKRVKCGDVISFSQGLEGMVIEVGPEGKRVLRFPSGNVLSELKKIGYAPLPPYIKRKKMQSNLKPLDLERYQTVFAETDGSIAAPTAGLHFTSSFLEQIRAKGVKISRITLDVGLATFQPVRVKRVEDHKMLEETYLISQASCLNICKAKKESRPIVAVGTTSVRTLESAFKDGKIHSGMHSTNLFIYPGFEFNVVDRLLTNFHLPKSTLLMLTSAFAGVDLIKRAYKEAVNHKYRFFSYGDCMLII